MSNKLFSASFVMLSCLLSMLPSGWAKSSAKPHQHKPLFSKSSRLTTLTTQQIARLTLPSIVRLTVLDSNGNPNVQGSGFVVGKNLIATNVHVIKGAHAVTANFQNGRSEKVYGLVALDLDRDLALIYANTAGVRELPLAIDGRAEVGDPVVAVGSPEGLGGSISTGVISAIRLLNNTKVIQTTAPISHGSSGGALLDDYGRVLGVTSFYIGDGQNLNFAYASYHLKNLLPKQLLVYRNWSELEPLWAGSTAPLPTAPSPGSVAEAPPSVLSPPSSPSATQADLGYTDKPLMGLKGVAVVVEDLREDAVKDGLDAAQLKTEAELRLRKAGVTVFEGPDSSDNITGAYLYINVTTLKDKNLYAFSIRAALSERVRLSRDVPKITAGETWQSNSIGTVGSDNMTVSIRQSVSDTVDEFANAYLAQNPK